MVAAAVAAALLMAAAGPVYAQAKKASVVKKAKPKKFPISGQVSASGSAGLGTFVPGEQNRTSISTGLSMFFLMPMAKGLRFAAATSISKTLVDFAEDPFAARSRNSQIGDVLVLFLYTPMVASKGPARKMTAAEKAEAALNPSLAAGAGKPFKLPGGIAVNGMFGFTLPMSRTAKYQTRITIARLAINFSRKIGPFSAVFQTRFDKRFNRYSNWIVDYNELGTTPLARENGDENIGDMMVATSNVNIAFTFRNRLLLTLPTGTPLTLQASYQLINNWNEYDSPKDEFTSPNAKAGRGRSDLQLSSLSAAYNFGGGWFGAFSTQIWSAVWTNDNQRLRWPFFDPRYASNNATTLNLSLTRGF